MAKLGSLCTGYGGLDMAVAAHYDGTHLAIRNRQGLCRVVGGAVPSGAESWRFDTNRLGYRGTGGHFVRRFSLPTVQSRWGTQGGKR